MSEVSISNSSLLKSFCTQGLTAVILCTPASNKLPKTSPNCPFPRKPKEHLNQFLICLKKRTSMKCHKVLQIHFRFKAARWETGKTEYNLSLFCYTIEMKKPLQDHEKFMCIKNVTTMRTFRFRVTKNKLRSSHNKDELTFFHPHPLPTPAFCLPPLLQFKLRTIQFPKNKFKRRVARLHLFKLIF